MVARSTSASPSPSYCPAGELALSPQPSPSLQPPASSLASPGALSWRARLPAPACHHRRRLAITAITATQACWPSVPSCRQAGPALLSSPRPPLLAMCLEVSYCLHTHTHTLSLSLCRYSTVIQISCPGSPSVDHRFAAKTMAGKEPPPPLTPLLPLSLSLSLSPPPSLPPSLFLSLSLSAGTAL